jgi:hypothetical protein
MSSVVISGDTSGAITLSAPAVSGTNTATLPAATGTVMVSGNMPAFSVWLSTNQSGVTNSVPTKVTFQTELYDTANCYDNATNYRFTPNVAGYYQINAGVGVYLSNPPARSYVSIYRNGSEFFRGNDIAVGTASGCYINTIGVSSLVYCNGSTDYLEIYASATNSGGVGFQAVQTYSFFNGILIRSA